MRCVFRTVTARLQQRRGFPRRLHAIDDRLYRATAAWRAPALDRLFPRLSELANRSFLWGIIALALGLSGRRGRRSALRGVVSIGAASAIGHVQAAAFARGRPDVNLVPLTRRVRRHPVSASFPSRHTASAFAFATSVAMEQPAFAMPAFALATAVAYSRLYVGAHYPSDIVGGALLGSGVAVATSRMWPKDKGPGKNVFAEPGKVEWPRTDGSGLTLVVNPSSGSGESRDLSDRLRAELPAAEINQLDEGDDLEAALYEAARANVIGIAGGDGSVNCASGVALERHKPLLVVPGGTLNHFARDLGLESVYDAVAAARGRRSARVDVGCIAGRPFVNTASFGSYAELVDAREKLEDRIGKWPAAAVAAVRVFLRADPCSVEIDGRPMRVWAAFIGNGTYEPAGFAPMRRDHLDDGQLDVRLVVAGPRFARLRLILALATGTLGGSKVYKAKLGPGPVRIRSLQGPMRLAADGETFDGPAEFTIAKSDQRLTVLTRPADGRER